MEQSVKQKVEEYVRTNYKKTYDKSDILSIEETDTIFKITNHVDSSPLILSKDILK